MQNNSVIGQIVKSCLIIYFKKKFEMRQLFFFTIEYMQITIVSIKREYFIAIRSVLKIFLNKNTFF